MLVCHLPWYYVCVFLYHLPYLVVVVYLRIQSLHLQLIQLVVILQLVIVLPLVVFSVCLIPVVIFTCGFLHLRFILHRRNRLILVVS